MTTKTKPLFAGLVGLHIDRKIDLGAGLTLAPTYAHVFAPIMAAFARAPTGKPHPAPWKAVRGGVAFDVENQLCLAADFVPPAQLDKLNTAWLVAFLLRLKGAVPLRVPVISDVSFDELSSSGDASFFSLELSNRHEVLYAKGKLDDGDVEWVTKHWRSAAELFCASEDFAVAAQAFDAAPEQRSLDVALLTTWGAIERLFSSSHQELTFRIAVSVAMFLNSDPAERLKAFTETKKLYGARSKAAHGGGSEGHAEVVKSYELLRKCIIRIIETNHVPVKKDFEEVLFGVKSYPL